MTSLIYFSQYRYNQAKLSVEERAVKVLKVEQSLIYDMELLCLTGVEDKLQPDVKPTLELLRNAGIKVFTALFVEKIASFFRILKVFKSFSNHRNYSQTFVILKLNETYVCYFLLKIKIVFVLNLDIYIILYFIFRFGC